MTGRFKAGRWREIWGFAVGQALAVRNFLFPNPFIFLPQIFLSQFRVTDCLLQVGDNPLIICTYPAGCSQKWVRLIS